MKNIFKDRTFIPAVIFVAIIFLVSFLWRRYRDKDIKVHSKYAVARITKQLGSLKNGVQWYYEFEYNNSRFQGYRSNHKDYEIYLGDFFLVHFSSEDPNHSKLLYEYKFDDTTGISNITWDTIPISRVHNSRKK